MTAPLIVEVGQALYGPHWMRELARALDVNERTVRRWAAGEVEPRPGVYGAVHELLSERAAALDPLLRRVKVAADQTEAGGTPFRA
jgi:hypothetical protein